MDGLYLKHHVRGGGAARLEPTPVKSLDLPRMLPAPNRAALRGLAADYPLSHPVFCYRTEAVRPRPDELSKRRLVPLALGTPRQFEGVAATAGAEATSVFQGP